MNELSAKNSLDTSFKETRKKSAFASKHLLARELTKYDGTEFIINAYRALLKRGPDEEGLDYYLNQLKEGKSKVAIIKQVQLSSEGKKNNVKIKGLSASSFFDWIKENLLNRAIQLTKFLPRISFEKISKTERLEILLQQTLTELLAVQAKLSKIDHKIKSQDKDIHKLYEETGTNLHLKIPNWDQFYSNFEDVFRGPPEIIKERIQVYIPIVQEALTKNNNSPVLDLGCGRGEWLELLKENKIKALGIDSNPAMIEQCDQRGLDVTKDDAMTYLKKQKNQVFGSVTGFHIIEHLPFITLMSLLDEIYRTLKSGGMVILETPNPHNVIVSSNSFHYDPTHKKPLPPELMKFILDQKGFTNIMVKELNSLPNPIQDASALTEKFNELFFGPQDYAIIGYKN